MGADLANMAMKVVRTEVSDEIDYRRIAQEFRSDVLRRQFGNETKARIQYRRVIDDLFDQGVKYAHAQSLNEEEFLYQVLQPIRNFIYQFASSFLSDEELATRPNFWTHRANPINDIVSKTNLPKIDRDSLQESAQLYLDLPVRHQRVDRCIIDALVAAEVFAFADEMINEPKIPLIPSRSPLRRSHPLWAFIKGQLGNVIGMTVVKEYR